LFNKRLLTYLLTYAVVVFDKYFYVIFLYIVFSENVLCFSRDAKLLVPAKNIGSIVHDLGYIKSVGCNATGTKVSFIAIKVVLLIPSCQCDCLKTSKLKVLTENIELHDI